MPTAYRHRPMSEILAPAPETKEKVETSKGAAAPKTEDKEPTIPEKYKGKSTAQVIEMHQNAEQELGRVRNEVGTYRGLVQDLSALQRKPLDSETADQEPVDVSGDDLIAQPVETIRKVIKQDLDKLREESAENVLNTQLRAENQALVTEFGDIDAVVGTDDFRQFATRTAGRQADFNVAATGTGLEQVRAARRLLEDYNDFNTALKANEKTDDSPTEAARKVATEGSGPSGSVSAKEQIFEFDVIELIISDPAKYRSPSYQKELLAAIKEGRYVKTT